MTYSESSASHTVEALGQSENFIRFQEQISRVAPVERPVMILGERGTGKELAASRIHFLSGRWEKPFVTLNCAALTPTLIESELFGYEKGAFSGALARKIGRFEKASSGTLFLDEVGNIPMEVQEKILRVVEYGSFERVGSADPIQVDVRIVAATNVDLVHMARIGRFKQDLLDRLSFEVIYVPPLRNRKEDILLLANHFAGRMAFELGREQIPTLSEKAVRALENHSWPGNVRELKNVVERAVYKSASDHITDIVFDPFQHPFGRNLEQPGTVPGQTAKTDSSNPDITPATFEDPDILKELEALPFKEAVGRLEVHFVTKALERVRFNQKQAASALGLTYDQFRGIKRKHGL